MRLQNHRCCTGSIFGRRAALALITPCVTLLLVGTIGTSCMLSDSPDDSTHGGPDDSNEVPEPSTARTSPSETSEGRSRYQPNPGSQVLSPSPDADHAMVSDANGEALPTLTPWLQYAWTNADAEAGVASFVDGHTLQGSVHNLTDQVLAVEIHARGDAGTNHTVALPVAVVELGAGEFADVDLPLDAFGFDFEAQIYSGRVSVKLFAFDEGSGHRQAEYAPTLYFHPEDEGVLVYGEELLRTMFHAGDFAGLNDIEPAPDTVITRIVQGTRVHCTS